MWQHQTLRVYKYLRYQSGSHIITHLSQMIKDQLNGTLFELNRRQSSGMDE